jgi:signal transduction histidine kinase
MRLQNLSFAQRMILIVVATLLLFSVLTGLLSHRVAQKSEQQLLQQLSRELARNIVSHWPVVMAENPHIDGRAEREALLSMLMVVNPAIQVYVLNRFGGIVAFINPLQSVNGDVPTTHKVTKVDLQPIEQFLGGGEFPIFGTDPLDDGQKRIFSVAKFEPKRSHQPDLEVDQSTGYLYITLNNRTTDNLASQLGYGGFLKNGLLNGLLMVGLALGTALLFAVHMTKRLTIPLRAVASRINSYHSQYLPEMEKIKGVAATDDIRTLEDAFSGFTNRIEKQALQVQQQAAASREIIAGIAHDLRTPLNALQGNLELLNAGEGKIIKPISHARVISNALAQSRRLSLLCGQLFELAALQLSSEIATPEFFPIDELVADIVQQMTQSHSTNKITFVQSQSTPIVVRADIRLMERALVNLIANAIQHNALRPVSISVAVTLLDPLGELLDIVVEDDGDGLPENVRAQLAQSSDSKELPLIRPQFAPAQALTTEAEADFQTKRPLGRGLGLSITQRIAQLHGGFLSSTSKATRGARLQLRIKTGKSSSKAL